MFNMDKNIYHPDIKDSFAEGVYDTAEECLDAERVNLSKWFTDHNESLESHGPAVNAVLIKKRPSKKKYSCFLLSKTTVCHANNRSSLLENTEYYIQSLTHSPAVLYKSAEKFWSFYYDRPDGVFKDIVGKECENISYLFDDEGKKVAVVIKVDNKTDFLQLHTAVVLARTPLERSGSVLLYDRLMKSGKVSEIEARYLCQNFMGDDSFVSLTPSVHFPFPTLAVPFNTFVNGPSNKSGRKLGGGYTGCYHFYSAIVDRPPLVGDILDLSKKAATVEVRSTFNKNWLVSRTAYNDFNPNFAHVLEQCPDKVVELLKTRIK